MLEIGTPGSVSREWKRGPWWNCDPTRITERAGIGTAFTYRCARHSLTLPSIFNSASKAIGSYIVRFFWRGDCVRYVLLFCVAE